MTNDHDMDGIEFEDTTTEPTPRTWAESWRIAWTCIGGCVLVDARERDAAN